MNRNVRGFDSLPTRYDMKHASVQKCYPLPTSSSPWDIDMSSPPGRQSDVLLAESLIWVCRYENKRRKCVKNGW